MTRSTLTAPARLALGVGALAPEHDRALLVHGIGFTDVVKRPTAKARDLEPREFVAGVEQLLAKLERYAPRIACFQGITGYRAVHAVLAGNAEPPELGLQPVRAGATRIFLVPNPSGANAHVTREQQTAWYDALAVALAGSRERVFRHCR